MKRSRSAASKKRPAAKSGRTTKPKKARSTAARRRTTKKAASRTAKKKTIAARKPAKKKPARKPAKNTTRAAKPKPKAKPAPKRRAATKKKPGVTRVARAPKVAPPVAPAVPANELKVGVVTHYYSHLSVAVVSLTDRGLRVGDRIHVKGHTSDFYQTVESLQVEHESVMAAQTGQAVGMKVSEHAREHDTVYLVT